MLWKALGQICRSLRPASVISCDILTEEIYRMLRGRGCTGVSEPLHVWFQVSLTQGAGSVCYPFGTLMNGNSTLNKTWYFLTFAEKRKVGYSRDSPGWQVLHFPPVSFPTVEIIHLWTENKIISCNMKTGTEIFNCQQFCFYRKGQQYAWQAGRGHVLSSFPNLLYDPYSEMTFVPEALDERSLIPPLQIMDSEGSKNGIPTSATIFSTSSQPGQTATPLVAGNVYVPPWRSFFQLLLCSD